MKLTDEDKLDFWRAAYLSAIVSLSCRASMGIDVSLIADMAVRDLERFVAEQNTTEEKT